MLSPARNKAYGHVAGGRLLQAVPDHRNVLLEGSERISLSHQDQNRRANLRQDAVRSEQEVVAPPPAGEETDLAFYAKGKGRRVSGQPDIRLVHERPRARGAECRRWFAQYDLSEPGQEFIQVQKRLRKLEQLECIVVVEPAHKWSPKKYRLNLGHLSLVGTKPSSPQDPHPWDEL